MSTPINVPNYVPVQYRQNVANASAKWNVPADLIAAVIQTESGWQPQIGDNVDSYGSYGLGQFLPGTAASLGVNTHDPASSIDGVGHLLHNNYQATGNWNDAVAAYNTGLGGIVNGSPNAAGNRYLSAVKNYLTGGTASTSGTTTATEASLNWNPLDGFGIPGEIFGAGTDWITKLTTTVFGYFLDATMIGAGLACVAFGLYLTFKDTR